MLLCGTGQGCVVCVQGRGLGRMFLRHLRRTRIILHVVDAATGVQSLPTCFNSRFCLQSLGKCIDQSALLTRLVALSETM